MGKQVSAPFFIFWMSPLISSFTLGQHCHSVEATVVWLRLCLASVAGSGETGVPLGIGRAELRSLGSFPRAQVARGRDLTGWIYRQRQLITVCQHLGPGGAELKSAHLALLEEQSVGTWGERVRRHALPSHP